MISTQAQAVSISNTAEGGLESFTVEQCNQIANISKRTIKAAISGVHITEVINKFTVHAAQFVLTEDGKPIVVPSSQTFINGPGPGEFIGSIGEPLNDFDYNDLQALEPPSVLESNGTDVKVVADITAIYKTVNQIKTKYGQVRPQDRVRLNNRVEQKLLECREMAFKRQTKPG